MTNGHNIGHTRPQPFGFKGLMEFLLAGLGVKKTCPWVKGSSASSAQTKQKNNPCLPAFLVIARRCDSCIMPVAFCEVDKLSECTRDLKYDDLQAADRGAP